MNAKPKQLWFHQERHLDRWSNVLSHGERPNRRKPDGYRVLFRADPVPVPPILFGLTSDQVASFLVPGGEFHGYQMEPIANFLRRKSSGVLVLLRQAQD